MKRMYLTFFLFLLSMAAALSVSAEDSAVDITPDENPADSASSPLDTTPSNSELEGVPVEPAPDVLEGTPDNEKPAAPVSPDVEDGTDADLEPTETPEEPEPPAVELEGEETTDPLVTPEPPSEEIPAENELDDAEPEPTIWDKPLNEYTPTEGLLLCICVLLTASGAFKLAKTVWL